MPSNRPSHEHVFDPGAASFPIRDDIRSDESGQGYALRMSCENLLRGLGPLKQWLKKSRFAVLDDADAPALSQWFGADLDALARRLGKTSTGRAAGGFEYAGMALGRSYFLNRSYPRVCPQCLTEEGHCRLAWDLALCTACPFHALQLVEACPDCGRRLDWNRQSMMWCNCSGDLSASAMASQADSLDVGFARWIRSRLDGIMIEGAPCDHGASLDAGQPLLSLLRPLSIDGGLHLVHALASGANYCVADGAQSKRRKGALSHAREVLRGANLLAEKLVNLEPVSFRLSRPATATKLLSDAATQAVTPEDRAISLSILEAVLRQGKRTDWAGRYPAMSQRSLF